MFYISRTRSAHIEDSTCSIKDYLMLATAGTSNGTLLVSPVVSEMGKSKVTLKLLVLLISNVANSYFTLHYFTLLC